MKFVKMLLTPPIMAISATLTLSAAAANRFVSNDGTWKMTDESGQEMTGTCYADDRANNKSALQKAIDAASGGDTVWVKNDYDCDFGGALGSSRAESVSNRINVTGSAITLRGEDDDWRNGPIIRGQHDPDSANGIGPKSMRALFLRRNPHTVIGFQLLDGSCKTDSSAPLDGGGCVANYSIAGTAVISNCLIAGGAAVRGGGAWTGIYRNCVISNCMATAYGGGTIVASLYDCMVISNRAASAGGSAGSPHGAVNCQFIGNKATAGNSAGGGADTMTLKNCWFEGNSAGGYGGGSSGCTSYNCVYLRNVRWNDGSNNRGGGAVNGGNHYNCLFAYNTAASYGGAAYGANCYNCTAYANTNTLEIVRNQFGGFYGGTLVNCVSFGNVGADDAPTSATTSCLQRVTIPATWIGCINIDPRLDADLRPHARACRNVGCVFDWMTDEADVRSKDLAGNPRIAPGKEKPDMGCYETPFTGLMMIVR